MNNGTKWTRCFLSGNGSIYFEDNKVSRDGGKTLVEQKDIDVEEINRQPEIIEVEPNIVFMQVDQWYCRIMLIPLTGNQR
jgi:hypothetical protein